MSSFSLRLDGHIRLDLLNQRLSKEILQQINLSLPDDCFIAVTGPNGGGKSTLAKMIAGIEQPASGQILLNELEGSSAEIYEIGDAKQAKTIMNAIWDAYEVANNL